MRIATDRGNAIAAHHHRAGLVCLQVAELIIGRVTSLRKANEKPSCSVSVFGGNPRLLAVLKG